MGGPAAHKFSPITPTGPSGARSVYEVGLRNGKDVLDAMSLAVDLWQLDDRRAWHGEQEYHYLKEYIQTHLPQDEAVALVINKRKYHAGAVGGTDDDTAEVTQVGISVTNNLQPGYLVPKVGGPDVVVEVIGGADYAGAMKAASQLGDPDVLMRQADDLSKLPPAVRPATDEHLKQIEQYRDGLEKYLDSIDAAPADPDAPQVALAPEEKTRKLVQPVPMSTPVASPDAPAAGADSSAPVTSNVVPAGDVVSDDGDDPEPVAETAEASATRELRAAAPEGGGQMALDSAYTAFQAAALKHLRVLRSLYDEAIRSTATPIPSYPMAKGGTSFSIDVDSLRELDGSDPPVSSQGPGALFATLMNENPPLTKFFKFGSDDPDRDAWIGMLSGGRWKTGSEPIGPGDLVRVGNPIAPGGRFWAIALTANGRTITEALAIISQGASRTLLKTNVGVPIAAWQPMPHPLFDDSTGMGRFWGPGQKRLVATIQTLYASSAIEDILQVVCKGTRHAASHVGELAASIGPELHRIDGKTPIYPGSVLLTRSDDELGVALADGRVGGVSVKTQEPLTDFFTIARFEPFFIWYPQA